jgi:hypothetical protein
LAGAFISPSIPAGRHYFHSKIVSISPSCIIAGFKPKSNSKKVLEKQGSWLIVFVAYLNKIRKPKFDNFKLIKSQ